MSQALEANARLIGSGQYDSTAVITEAVLTANDATRYYLIDTAAINAYDSVYYFLSSCARQNQYQIQCAALLTDDSSTARATANATTISSLYVPLFGVQDFIASNHRIKRSYGYDLADSLIDAADDSTWFGFSALRGWLEFNDIKKYDPVFIHEENSSSTSQNAERFIEDRITKRTLFEAYPNPTYQRVNIALVNPLDEIQFIRIASVDGKIVYNNDRFDDSQYEYSIDLSSIPQGIYYLEVQNKSAKGDVILLSVIK
jgi:hypothetical protein